MNNDKEILDAFNLRPQGLPHYENVKFLEQVLKIKNAQIKILEGNLDDVSAF